MTYGPAPSAWLPSPVSLSSYSRASLGAILAAASGSVPSSAVWTLANRTVYIPFWTTAASIAYRMFVLNGATVGTDTWSLAIYSSDSNYLPATNLVEASATSAGANACQFLDITDTPLAPGTFYYMAAALSGTTATVMRANIGNIVLPFLFMEASNTPATATPIAGQAAIPVFGVSLRASV